MEYVNLGKSGLKVSRLCLGTMTYGTPAWRPWVLDEEREPAVHQAGARTRHQLLRHRRHVLARRERGGRSAARCATSRRATRSSIATKVFFPMGPGPNDRGLSRKHILDAIDASLRRLGVDYVDLYQIHRCDPRDADRGDARGAARRREGRQGALHRRVEHVRLAVREGALPRRPARLDALRVDAEPLQPGLPRRRAGDAAALPRRGRRRHPVEPAGARLPGRQPAPRGLGRDLARQDRRLRPEALLQRRRLQRRRPRRRRWPASAA